MSTLEYWVTYETSCPMGYNTVSTFDSFEGNGKKRVVHNAIFFPLQGAVVGELWFMANLAGRAPYGRHLVISISETRLVG